MPADQSFYQQLLQMTLAMPPPGTAKAQPPAATKEPQAMPLPQIIAMLGEEGFKKMYPGGASKYIVGGSVQQPMLRWPPPGQQKQAAPVQTTPEKQISAEEAGGQFDKMFEGLKEEIAPKTALPDVSGVK